MKKVKVAKLSKQEKEDLTAEYGSNPNPEITLEKLLADNENQTLAVLRQIKNIVEWKDIEKMVDYVLIMKKFDKKTSTVEIDNDQHKLVLELFQDAVKSGKVNGYGLEKIVQIYSEFKNAQ